MNNANKTKAQLIEELRALQQRLGEADRATEMLAGEIAEKQRTEAQLRENINRLRLQIEITSDWLWEVDRDGTYTYVSPKVRELLGYEPEEIIGKTPFDLMPADEAEQAADEFRNVVALKKPLERLVNVNLCKDGHRVVLETSAVPVLDVDGKLLGYRGIDRDITVRDRAEEALRDSEQRYRAIVEDQTELICRWLPGGVHTFVNEAYCRCFGKSHDQLVGHNLMELIPREDHQRVIEHFTSLCHEKPVATHEHRVIACDLVSRWHQWTDRAIFDQTGNIVEYQSVGRDITERKRAEEALRRSEERFRTLFENTPIGFYRTTPDGRIDDANPALIKILGFSSFEELAQRNLEDGGFGPEYARNEFRRRIEREGAITLDETAWKKRDGSVIFVRENARAIRAADGQVKYYEGTVEDVTQRRKVEHDLRQSEGLFRTVVSASKDAMIAIDCAGLITIFNRAAEKLFGRANQTMIGQPLDCLMPAEYRDRHRIYLNSFFTAGVPNRAIGTTLELPALHRDGTIFPVELSLSASERDDEPFVLAVIRDITERKRAEEILRAERDYSARIINGTPAIICGIAPDGSTTFVNPAGEHITGYAAEELVGRNWWHMLYPGAEYRQVERLFQDFEQGDVLDYEMVLTTRTGEKCTIAWNSINRFDETGRLVEIIGFGNDVTQRKRAEEELRKFKTITDQARYGAAITDLEGHLVYVNDSFVEMHGYTPAEFTGKHLSVFHTEQQIQRVNELNQRLRKEGSYTAEEVWHVKRDGRVFPTLMNASLIRDEHGAPLFMSATAIDITDRKRTEDERARLAEQLQQAQKNANGRAGGRAHCPRVRYPAGDCPQWCQTVA